MVNRRMLAEIEAQLTRTGPTETRRLRQPAELIPGLLPLGADHRPIDQA
jgi:hypothetical protein